MNLPPLPVHESKRLAALLAYEILDTPAEQDFDDFTQLALQICGTPMAVISLVDTTRVWFKSTVGVTNSEAPREHSFTAHAILGNTLFEVPNTLADSRFNQNPLVTGEPGIRFYAGAPLITPEGHAIGALCVIDDVPRQLTARQSEVLTVLSRQVVHLLELRSAGRRIQSLNENLELKLVKRNAALRARERHFRAVLDSAHDAIISADHNGLILSWNKVAQAIFGHPAEEVVDRPLTTLLPERYRGWHTALMQEYLATGNTQLIGKTFELYGLRRDNSEFPMELSLGTWSEGDRQLFTGILRDITERKRVEASRLQAEERYRNIFEHVVEGIFQTTHDGRYLDVNPALARMYGYESPADLIGTIADIQAQVYVDPNRREEFKALLEENNSIFGFESQIYRKDGSIIWLSENARAVRDEGGRLLYYEGTTENITERKKIEEALRDSEERFRQLAEQSSEGFWFAALNPERIIYVSPAVERIWGIPAGQFYQDAESWMAAIHPDDRKQAAAAWEACLRGRTPRFESEYRVVRPDGTTRWVLDSGTPFRNARGEIVRIGGIAKDVTERRQVESQKLRTQRLESIGTLAGGVAHDLNNVLAPILMATDLLHLQYPANTDLIDTIEMSAKRGADMVRQLLTFAKGVEGDRLLVQPRHMINELEKIIRGTFPKNIQVRTNYPKDLDKILGDPTQLHQVLLNLCVNARDAMPNGGTLTLEAENVEIDAIYATAAPEAKLGRYVICRVIDTGSGIPPETLERIFEPFFSTKGPDKGTGLGLSTVLGIVKSHGGFVRVYSTPGQGTTFTVYLPATGTTKGDTDILTKSTDKFRGNGETILVVDDEAAVRKITCAVLAGLNFQVLTAADGTEALIKAAERRKDLRAVITDLHMPHMDGLTFVRAIKRMVPEAGIMVVSGRLEEREANEFKSLGVGLLIDKPFTQEKLTEALKSLFPQKS